MAEILQGNIPKNEADANPESARRAKLNRIFGVIAILLSPLVKKLMHGVK